jgi:GTP-binding protein
MTTYEPFRVRTLEVIEDRDEHGFALTHLPEVAFFGRSNVGKSSVINSLLGRKNIARVSGRPGKTTFVYFYVVNDAVCLADLPGYGYAKAARSERRRWIELIERYVDLRERLIAGVVLVDSRRGPEEEEQYLFRALADVGVTPIPVVTKVDKLKKSKRYNQLQKVFEMLPPSVGEAVAFSVPSRLGRDILWKRIMDLVQGAR